MTKTPVPVSHAVFYGVVALVILVVIGFIAWVADQSYVHKLVPYLKSVSCAEEASDKSCSISYTLKNKSDKEIRTDLNGINGPGFAESHVSDVNAILDDGTTVPIFAGSDMDFSGKISAYETIELTDKFKIPKDRRVVAIKIVQISFEIPN
jgi:hypothetical protein